MLHTIKPMTWRDQLKKKKALVSEEEWGRLLLASAHAVLVALDTAKPRKQQSRVSVVSDDLMAHDVRQAVALRNAGPTPRTQLLQWAKGRLPWAASELCFLAAIQAARCEITIGPGTCCFTQKQMPDCHILSLYGNKDGEHHKRLHTMWPVSTNVWVEWVQACINVGNVHEWLDGHVARWLKQREASTMDRALAQQLTTDAELMAWRTSFNDACIVLYNSLLG